MEMAAKKYYAVKKGKITGVFDNWAECKASVDGYSGAAYKGFASLEEAQAYAGIRSVGRARRPAGEQSRPGSAESRELPEPGTLLAYVDGSYEDSLKKYAFGCVFLLSDGRIFTEYGNGNNEQFLRHRNVTGEVLGAMFAVQFAMVNNFSAIEILYDYEGIERWATGEWRSRTELTQKYVDAMQDWGKQISIRFTKVTAHTNVKYNELADKLAKTGLREGNGVPKARLLRDMEEYCEEGYCE